MNQVELGRISGNPGICGVRTALTGAALVVLAAMLTACDPSPASRALKNDAESSLAGPVPGMQLAQEPAQAPEPVVSQPTATEPVDDAGTHESEPETAGDGPVQFATVEADPEAASDKPAMKLLGQSVAPGTSSRLMWSASRIFEGISTKTPVLVVNGSREGPTMCLTAAIHGDELNGIEMVRRVLHELDPKKLNGAVIGIPIVNLQGFRRGSRYLPDRRDLNRYFPGNAEGSSAARIADSLFQEIILRCDALVDLHTGSFYRTNLPQLRADLRYGEIRELTQGFGGMVVLHSEAAPGTLRRAAVDAGIPAVTLEAGEPLRLQSNKVSQGVTGIFKVLGTMGMVKRVQFLVQSEPIFYQSAWVRADHGGILFSVVRLGQLVDPGDVLGTVTDPITNEQNLIYSPEKGRVLGMALNQVVMPGFAAFRIGIETDGSATDAMVASLEWKMNTRQEAGSANITTSSPPPEADDAADLDQAEETSEE